MTDARDYDDSMTLESGAINMPNFRGDSPSLLAETVADAESAAVDAATDASHEVVVAEAPQAVEAEVIQDAAADAPVADQAIVVEQPQASDAGASVDAGAIQVAEAVAAAPANEESPVAEGAEPKSELDPAQEKDDETPEELVRMTLPDGQVIMMPLSRLQAMMAASQAAQQPPQEPKPAVPKEQPQQPAAQGGGPGPYADGGGVVDGLKGLGQGVNRLLGGTLSVLGVAAGGVGTGVNALANQMTKKKDAVPGKGAVDGLGVGVMPRITDYRAQQVERAVSAYEEGAAALWDRPSLASVRDAVAERARTLGKPVADVVSQMRPGGAHEDLSAAFQAGVAADPLALKAKEQMEKSLSTWSNQNVAATPEMAGGDGQFDAQRRGIKARIESANERMETAASMVPPFKDEDESHLQRIQAVMRGIVEAIKNFVGGLTNRGSEASHAPAA